ncbi:FAD-dependent 5-carboxymethylaminomethyl-2-thiouridine(34) oxidoreductase MnmC [Psychrobacter phenylpyruvicus]|uniref:tRNA 5-methylaminomethyl-2-thiouridine biosynthesis bifunctional protein MnmC n=1 Tax=Psychrobacter phenylpyruvicus TaxID=29432 RepID=A0A379LH99_9GAMM|nr:FAD-dependent 5-carboxymethylaminomethyl-2-thiouridine(34) oxidoreductase MnmC [Psychrobacter phenylpyruvicus]SUD89979.1 tRNA 5-methylaminomethyl-2-thiouridine biosynthesis bifunctional protein MnmC [Psychrobacter phenylpyruvicus]
MSEVAKVIPAKLSWREDELGNLVPVSEVFGDVYYSLADGLAESRYVFLQQNHLPERFAALFEQYLNSLDTDSHNAVSNTKATNESTLTSKTSNSFTIAELGFGTGLNILATWQLWRQTKQTLYSQHPQQNACKLQLGQQAPRLHLISTEKHPLTFDDLTRSLQSWQENDPSLTPLITRLLALYPTLVSGCHRLHLEQDVTLDLWLGDATESLQKLAGADYNAPHQAQVDAWYLDGFAPSCNESLWAEQIFEQVQRLSNTGTTAATFSCAGVVKRGLESAGFEIKKVKGFGRKREMLTANKAAVTASADDESDSLAINHNKPNKKESYTKETKDTKERYKKVAIIGAGVSGLMAAWSLAQRGLQITLIDQSAPLAGASGNPRALLAPKMTPIAHVAEHLHSIGYLYSQRLYRQLDRQNELLFDSAEAATHLKRPSQIFEGTGTLDLLVKSNVDVAQIAEYPEQMATTLAADKARDITGLEHQDLIENLYLPQAGLVNPKALADTILNHSNIRFKQAKIQQIQLSKTSVNAPSNTQNVQLIAKSTVLSDHSDNSDADRDDDLANFDAVIIATAFDSQNLDARIFEFRRIRGQLSWFQPTQAQLTALPKLPLKYGGYCASFTPCKNDELVNPVSADTPSFLLGASFVRNDMDTQIRTAEHEVNHQKLITAIPELDSVLLENGEKPADYSNWQARVGIRAQTPDYHPLVGQVDEEGLIWTLSGMGSKGYAFAPLCAEVIADMMLGQYTPLPQSLLERLSPQRNSLQKPLPK